MIVFKFGDIKLNRADLKRYDTFEAIGCTICEIYRVETSVVTYVTPLCHDKCSTNRASVLLKCWKSTHCTR